MKYIELLEKIHTPVFSIQDLKISNVSILPYQISKLKKDGYINKIRNGLYIFSNKKDSIPIEHLAFRLYEPSYISLESALFYYGIIPEIIYNVTSISTRVTRKFKNDFGIFIYRNIKKELFWGYRKEEKDGLVYLIAEPEKALLDYLYFNIHKIKNTDDIDGLRLNYSEIKELDIKKLNEYTTLFKNEKIKKIISEITK